jgi:hypothetical protein
MKYLEKFVTYLNESSEDITDLSKEDLDDLLTPISHLGIEYDLSTPTTITEGEFSGYKSMNIRFTNNFKYEAVGSQNIIIDERFWEFLDELVALKNRLESSRVSINSNWKTYIVVTFIQKAKVEGDLFTIQKLYNDMSAKTNAAKSDFCYALTKKLYPDELKIVVNIGGYVEYTDRKWNGLFRGVDFSKFNIEKKVDDVKTSYGGKSYEITITLKK